MKYDVKIFWKGTIMFHKTMNQKQYNGLGKQLAKDFFKGCEDRIDETIDWLNHTEHCYFLQQRDKGSYFLDDKYAVPSLLIINSLIKRGLAKNDDMTGFLITKSYK